MPTLRAAIFDFDGLILDTESAGFAALQAVFARHGATYSLDDYLQIVGTHYTVLDPLRLFQERTGRQLDRADFERECRAEEARLHERLEILPGVTTLLDTARRAGLRLAVASSSSHEWVDGFLKQFGLFARFETVVCRGDAPRVKPEPDLYLEALRRLGLRGAEAVAFEDSHNGSLAAKRAGLWCVAVPNAVTRTQDFRHADLCVDTLAGFDLAAFAAARAQKS